MYCECGCGQRTTIPRYTNNSNGRIKGKPLRFIRGHSNRKETHPQWKGGKRMDKRGYVLVLSPAHPRAVKGYVPEHILIAEQALGKFLPVGAVVHHVDENTSHNTNDNLVICPGQGYHSLLHQRLRALRACGNPNWRKCQICKQYDNPRNLSIRGTIVFHRYCRNEQRKEVSRKYGSKQRDLKIKEEKEGTRYVDS